MALTWLTWPTLLIFRRAWSIRNGIYVLIGFLLLSPCVSRAAFFACYAFGYWRTPTVDRPTVEQSENLGYGFSVIAVAEDRPGGIDRFLQTKYLYLRGNEAGAGMGLPLCFSGRIQGRLSKWFECADLRLFEALHCYKHTDSGNTNDKCASICLGSAWQDGVCIHNRQVQRR
jgi:hypothetical protein